MADLKAADAIVYHGRATESGTDLVLPKHGGAGFTLKGNISGHVDVTLNHSEYASALNVVIDGYADTCNALLGDVREAYPDAYIIWGYGMMFDKGVDQLQAIVEAYAESTGDDKIVFCDFSSVKNNNGSASHPDQSGHNAAANLLIACIRTYCPDI